MIKLAYIWNYHFPTFVSGKIQWLLHIFASLAVLSMSSQSLAAQTVYEGFQSPTGIAVIPGRAIYISDWSANTITRIDKDGTRTVVARDIPSPAGLAVDWQGALFIASYSADYILRLDRDGSTRRVAENLSTPTGISFSCDGSLLVANRGAGQVVSVDVSTGRVSLVADGFSLPVGVVEMDDGSIVVSQYGGRVTRVARNGKRQELGAPFNRPGVGIAADGANAVLVVDNGASVVRRITFDGNTSVVGGKLSGSAVALGRGIAGEWLAGAWGTGAIYRLQP
jgi:streptogramin lyase